MMSFWQFIKQERSSSRSISLEQDNLLKAANEHHHNSEANHPFAEEGESHDLYEGWSDEKDSQVSQGLNGVYPDDAQVDQLGHIEHTPSEDHISNGVDEHAIMRDLLSTGDRTHDTSSDSAPIITADIFDQNSNLANQHDITSESVDNISHEQGNETAAAPQCLIIIDSKYPNFSDTTEMMQGLGDVFVLNDGVEALAEIRSQLENLKNVVALHLFAEAIPGGLTLGGEDIVLEDLDVKQKILLRSWREFLAKQSVVYIYDDALSNSAAGRYAIELLEELIGASVIVPRSDVGVSIQLADDANAWSDHLYDPSNDSDLLTNVTNDGIDQVMVYSRGKPTHVPLFIDSALLNAPLVTASIQVSDGVLAIRNTLSVSFQQRPQVGPKLMIKGEPIYVKNALEKLVLFSASQDGVFIRITIKDIADQTMLDKVISLTAEREPMETEHSSAIEFRPIDRYVYHNTEIAEIQLVLPDNLARHFPCPTHLLFKVAQDGGDLTFSLDRDKSTQDCIRYFAQLSGIRNGCCSIELKPLSEDEIKAGFPQESAPVKIEKTLSLIVDASERYPPQLTEKGWCSVSAPSDLICVGETIDITISFSEPIHVQGSPHLEIEFDSGVIKAAYTGLHGLVLDQKLTFQYTVSPQDFADEGITIKGMSPASAGLIRGCDFLGRPSVAIDLGSIPVRRCPKITISEFSLLKIDTCQVDGRSYTKNQLQAYLTNPDTPRFFKPTVNVANLFPHGRWFAQFCCITRSWYEEIKINAIQFIDTPVNEDVLFGVNDWQDRKFQEIDSQNSRYRGFSIDVFALRSPVRHADNLSFQKAIEHLVGNVGACAQFAHHSTDSRGGISILEGIDEPYRFHHLASYDVKRPQTRPTHDNLSSGLEMPDTTTPDNQSKGYPADLPHMSPPSIHPYYRSIQQYKLLVTPEG